MITDMALFDMMRDKQSYLTRFESMSVSVVSQEKAMLKNWDDLCVSKFGYKGEKVIEELHALAGSRLENRVYDLIQDYVIHLKNNDIGVKTMKNYARKLKNYLAYRLELKITSDELRRNIKYPKESRERKHPLGHKEVRRLLDQAGDRKGLYLFMIGSGMAISETCRLRKRDFIFGGPRIKVHVPASYRKTRVEKITFVSKESEPYLLDRLKRIQDDDLVFGTHKENPRYSVINEEQIFMRVRKKAGLDDLKYESGTSKITIHSFRSFFITQGGKADFDLAHELAGHEEYKSNTEYNRYDDDYLLEFYLKAESYLVINDTTDIVAGQKELQKQLREANKEIEKIKAEGDMRIKQIESDKDRRISNLEHEVAEIRKAWQERLRIIRENVKISMEDDLGVVNKNDSIFYFPVKLVAPKNPYERS